ncbi:MAG: NUDIX domain-containing protein [Dehalococcoidia bacterium]|nr:NUDIX domain-containing protein [Dehalococcoidia bacterium]
MTTTPAAAVVRRAVVASGVRVRRDDGAVLLVRAPGAGVWSLPCREVPEDETAEDAALRLLREGLQLRVGAIMFATTLSIADAATELAVNVFDAIGWDGEPHYRDEEFADAGWLQPARLGNVDVLPEVAEWLRSEIVQRPSEADRAAIAAELVEARRALLAAFDAIAPRARSAALDGAWAPCDVLQHAMAVEQYELAEALQLAEEPGGAWWPWNERQGELARALHPQPDADVARARLDASHAETLRALQWLPPEQLAVRGTDPAGSTVLLADRLRSIAAHDLEHAAQLRAMGLRGEGDADAAADR